MRRRRTAGQDDAVIDLPAARAALAGPCPFQVALDDLTTSQRDQMVAALATDPPVVIAYALQQNQIYVADTAVRDHRDGDCRCTIGA